jgi:hypothetical protein
VVCVAAKRTEEPSEITSKEMGLKFFISDALDGDTTPERAERHPVDDKH